MRTDLFNQLTKLLGQASISYVAEQHQIDIIGEGLLFAQVENDQLVLVNNKQEKLVTGSPEEITTYLLKSRIDFRV